MSLIFTLTAIEEWTLLTIGLYHALQRREAAGLKPLEKVTIEMNNLLIDHQISDPLVHPVNFFSLSDPPT